MGRSTRQIGRQDQGRLPDSECQEKSKGNETNYLQVDGIWLGDRIKGIGLGSFTGVGRT